MYPNVDFYLHFVSKAGYSAEQAERLAYEAMHDIGGDFDAEFMIGGPLGQPVVAPGQNPREMSIHVGLMPVATRLPTDEVMKRLKAKFNVANLEETPGSLQGMQPAPCIFIDLDAGMQPKA